MKKREEIEDKYKWDLSSYCKSTDSFSTRLEKISKGMNEITKYKGLIIEGNDTEIFSAMKLNSEIMQEFSIICAYVTLKLSEDNSDSKINELMEKAESIYTEYSSLSTFLVTDLTKLGTPYLQKLSQNTEYPQFKRMLEDIILHKPHTLSFEEEQILSKIGVFVDSPFETFRKLTDIDMKFEDAVDSNGKKYSVNNSVYSMMRYSPDRTLRKTATESIGKTYKNFNDTLASIYIAYLKTSKALSDIRHYDSTLKQSLFDDEISEKLYNTLVSSVNKNIDIPHNYFKTKKEILGYKDFYAYDVQAPITPNYNPKFKYETSVEMVKSALQPLGKEYNKYVDRIFEKRLVDVYPNENKTIGGFSESVFGCEPVILMNYVDDLNSAYTLVHEVGHSVHSFFFNANQPYENTMIGEFLAEIASTVNETFFFFDLIKNAKTVDEKLYHYDHFLSNIDGTIFTQTQFSEFEQFAHDYYAKNKTISKEILNNGYENLNKKYYGKEVILSDNNRTGWTRIPHMYYDFYVYKYATGLITALKIVNDILQNKPNAKENYLEFLKSGESKPALETLKIVGADLEDEKTYDEVFAFIRTLENDFHNLLEEQKTLENNKKISVKKN